AKNACPTRPPRFYPSEGARSARGACGGLARTGRRIVAHRGARAPARGIQLQPDHVRVERARPDAGPIRAARDHRPGPGPTPDLLGRGAADADEPRLHLRGLAARGRLPTQRDGRTADARGAHRRRAQLPLPRAAPTRVGRTTEPTVDRRRAGRARVSPLLRSEREALSIVAAPL